MLMKRAFMNFESQNHSVNVNKLEKNNSKVQKKLKTSNIDNQKSQKMVLAKTMIKLMNPEETFMAQVVLHTTPKHYQ